MKERNEELFRQVADQIDAHPESHNQDGFLFIGECGAVACVCGWAVVLGEFMGAVNAAETWYFSHANASVAMWDRGQEALGLTHDESLTLFSPSWRPHDGLSVPDALRKIGEGASIEDVSAA